MGLRFGMFAGLALVLCAPLVLSAGLYKWEDEDGNIIYSDRPPPDAEVREIEPPPRVDTDSARRGLEDTRQRLEDLGQQREERAREEEERQRELEVAKANCENARDKLARVTKVTRVLTLEDDGSYRRIDESERQARIKEARKEIEEYCK